MTYELYLITKNTHSKITHVPPSTSPNYPFAPLFKLYRYMLHSFINLAIEYLLEYLHVYLEYFVV